MKRIYNIIGIALMAVAIISCGGQQKQQGTKFSATERTSSLTDDERQEALAKKRAELNIDPEVLFNSHGVKFSVVRPKVQGEDITDDIADRITIKLLEIASQNGISGMGTEPNFIFGTEIAQTGRAATATTPQKMTVNYTLTFKVANINTGDVFATATQEVLGVGTSFQEANQNAVKEIKNTPQLQKMLQTASERIIEWYNTNIQVVKNQVEKAEGEGDYALALALLHSIPEQATEAYKYVAAKQGGLLKGMLHKKAADMLGEMESVIASSGDVFNPAVGAYFNLIPVDAPEHAKAQALYAEYEKKCNARRADVEAKAERDEQAAREMEKLKMLYAHKEELSRIEESKIKAKYEAEAANKKAELKAQVLVARATKGKGGGIFGGGGGGLFGSLGDMVGGLSSRVFKAMDVVGTGLADKLGLDDYVESVEEKQKAEDEIDL